MDIIILYKNVYLSELCYFVYGFRERVYCVLDVGVYVVFFVVIVSRGSDIYFVVWVGYFVWFVVVVWFIYGIICKIKIKFLNLGNIFIFSLVYYKSKIIKNFNKYFGIYILEVIL